MTDLPQAIEILVDRAPSARCLVHRDRPVFPVHSDREWNALTRLAGRMGGTIREVIGVPGRLASSSEMVIALGGDAAPAAELYAHLTGRRYRHVEAVGHIDGSNPRVVVTTMPFLGGRLLDALYPGARGNQVHAPGILCAGTREDLGLRVLCTAALSLFDGAGPMQAIDLRPIEFAPTSHVPGSRTYDCETPSEEVRRALGSDCSLLMINTHSDGIDAFLGPELTLCSLLEKPLQEGEPSGPYCRETGICHRHGVSVAGARKSLVDPAEIAARVLVWSACYGVLGQDSVYAPLPGLLGSFLQGSAIGAVITSWGVSFSQRELLDGLRADLVQGMPLGEAVARLNRSETASKSGVRFCLFGEPDTYLPPLPHPSESALKTAVKDTNAHEKGYLELDFLRAYLTSCVLNLPAGLEHYLMPAIEAVQLYEYQCWLGAPVGGDKGSPGDVLRRRALDFLMRRGSGIFHVWLAFAEEMHSEEGGACPECERTTTVTRVRLRFPGVSDRSLVRCVRCGVIGDLPVWSDLALTFDGERFLLHGTLPQRDWSACLHLGCQNETESIAWEWPEGEDGSPADAFQPPGPWPKGPLRMAFMLLDGTAIHVLTLPGRAGPKTA